MKLVIAVVQDEDAEDLVAALVAERFRVTRVASTGSLLRTGNSTVFLGVDDSEVDRALAAIGTVCRRRTQVVVPYTPALEPGLLYVTENFEVEVGGAVIFAIDVERFERL